MNVAWSLCWGGSRSTKNYVFLCKVAAAGDGRYLMCAAGAAAVCCGRFSRECVPPLCSATMRVLNLWLQIAVEWLHGCHLVLPCA